MTRRAASVSASAALLLALSACGGAGGGAKAQGSATMRPGEDCVACHAAFTAAGTVYATVGAAAGAGVDGATVRIVDGVGPDLVLTTNAAGNFYTSAPIVWPAAVTVRIGAGTPRGMTAPSGGCASTSQTSACHAIARVNAQ